MGRREGGPVAQRVRLVDAVRAILAEEADAEAQAVDPAREEEPCARVLRRDSRGTARKRGSPLRRAARKDGSAGQCPGADRAWQT